MSVFATMRLIDPFRRLPTIMATSVVLAMAISPVLSRHPIFTVNMVIDPPSTPPAIFVIPNSGGP
jgi:hypothetical protein